MTKAEIYSRILEVSEKSYYRWKSKDHIVLINLIEKYFTDKELSEFIKTKKIYRFERQNLYIEFEKSIYDDVLEMLYNIDTWEFIFNFIINYKYAEINNISKDNFIIYLIKNFHEKIKEINEKRLYESGEEFLIIEEERKDLIFKSILNVLNELSSREFKHIVLTSEFYNSFNNNYLEITSQPLI